MLTFFVSPHWKNLHSDALWIVSVFKCRVGNLLSKSYVCNSCQRRMGFKFIVMYYYGLANINLQCSILSKFNAFLQNLLSKKGNLIGGKVSVLRNVISNRLWTAFETLQFDFHFKVPFPFGLLFFC
jgi:hypothetical protein